MSRFLLRSLLVVFFLFLSPANLSAAPAQQWLFSNTRLLDFEGKRLDLTLHTRFQGLDEEPTLYQIQPRFSLNCGKYFRCATNYSFFALRSKDTTGEELTERQNRLEFELNPRFKISDSWSYIGRNRIEYLMNSEFSYINSRFRHRDSLERQQIFGLSLRAFFANEIFYNLEESTVSQFRVVPLGVRIPWDKEEFSLYPMLVSNKRDGDWQHAIIIGVDFFFDLFG